MKREKISEAIGNISQKYIDEAAVYSSETTNAKKHTFSRLTAIAACFAVILATTCGYFLWRTVFPPKTVRYYSDYWSSDTAVNYKDDREYVGSFSYVFVAKVTETHDYYTERLFHRFPAVVDYYDSEFTECRLNVIMNIKGDLEVGKEFSFYKGIGVNKIRTCIIIYRDDDVLPEVGKYYIFAGFAHADGTMTGGGIFSLENGITESNLEESAVYQKYVDAFNNQIVKYHSIAVDYLCTADINYGDGSYNAKIYAEDLKRQEEIDRKYAEEQSMSYEEFYKKHFDFKYDKAVKKGNPKIK
ncbi:MAG: hypothetical protein K2G60_04590 [Oscillospiraceae bacterium]|nr:hypothetical protein [Oscillospiraceae bacterium]